MGFFDLFAGAVVSAGCGQKLTGHHKREWKSIRSITLNDAGMREHVFVDWLTHSEEDMLRFGTGSEGGRSQFVDKGLGIACLILQISDFERECVVQSKEAPPSSVISNRSNLASCWLPVISTSPLIPFEVVYDWMKEPGWSCRVMSMLGRPSWVRRRICEATVLLVLIVPASMVALLW